MPSDHNSLPQEYAHTQNNTEMDDAVDEYGAPNRATNVQIDIHPEDAKCTVLLAVIRALIMCGNRPSSPKELAAFILKNRLATLGGQTPYATVSSRISQHFKRSSEGSRPPILGKQPVIEPNRKTNTGVPRKWRYYVDAPGLPIGDEDEPIQEIEGLIGKSMPEIEEVVRRESGEFGEELPATPRRPSTTTKHKSKKKRRATPKAKTRPRQATIEPDTPPASATASVVASPSLSASSNDDTEPEPQQEASPRREDMHDESDDDSGGGGLPGWTQGGHAGSKRKKGVNHSAAKEGTGGRSKKRARTAA
ncbi:hypothetical protein HK104_001765 [Borealophlyctis nickersoniae]|nr:hypothetical protein HK104_001765 [Borealophlyctis nickersoniae]